MDVTVSLGVVAHTSETSFTGLVDGADPALYRATQGGRNRFEA